MTDRKISELTSATTLSGSEVFPLVQSGTTKSMTAAVLGEQLPFTPSGSGAVARTVQDKLRSSWVGTKDFGAVCDGVTDDTSAINAAATAARAAGKGLVIEAGNSKVSAQLDFSNLHVWGLGRLVSKITATSAQFDVIKTTANTTLEHFYVNGGWDGSTAGQSGDAIVADNGASFSSGLRIRGVQVEYAKKRGSYVHNFGYSSIAAVKVNACGLHGIELEGDSAAIAITTFQIGDECISSDTPNGYGLKLTQCQTLDVDGLVMENTRGISANGGDNRVWNFKAIHQESPVGGFTNFITFGASAGQGLTIVGCNGAGATTLPHTTGWTSVFTDGNSGLTDQLTPSVSKRITAGNTEATTTTTGGVDISVTSIAVPPGLWLLTAALQTLNASGCTLVYAGMRVSTSNVVTGRPNSTTTDAVAYCSDQASFNPGASADVRLNASDVIENQTGANVTYYMRAFINISAGTLAYNGTIKAVKIT